MYGQSYRTIPGQNLPFRWMAPEALRRRKFSEASDVWAFGVTAWEILTGGDMPFALVGNDEIVAERVCSGERLPRPPDCSEELWRLVLSCWKESAKDRPRFSDIATGLSRLLPTSPIIVKMDTGREIKLPFLPAETVAALKLRIQDNHGEF